MLLRFGIIPVKSTMGESVIATPDYIEVPNVVEEDLQYSIILKSFSGQNHPKTSFREILF